MTAAGPSSTAALFESRTLSNLLETLHLEGVTRFKAVFASETGSSHNGADTSDNVGLHLEFGRRFFFFTLEQQEAVVPGPRRSLNDVLMHNASRLCSAWCLSMTSLTVPGELHATSMWSACVLDLLTTHFLSGLCTEMCIPYRSGMHNNYHT